MTTKKKKLKKNPKYMDECFANEPAYELDIPRKKKSKEVLCDEEFDIGV